MTYLNVLLATLLLSSCGMIPSRAERDLEQFGPYCERLGYRADTDQWRGCIQQQTANREIRRLRY